MAEASEAMKAMARRIGKTVCEQSGLKFEYELANDAALAAIIETQRADADLAEDRYLETDWQEPGQHIAQAIRDGNNYAKDENNG